MKMTKNTAAKLATFYTKHPIGTKIVSLQGHEINSKIYPAWATLKAHEAVVLESSETVEIEYTDGITINVLYNVYRVQNAK